MKNFSTNYFDTFIEVADDCPATSGEVPPLKGDAKTIASMQFEMISKNPYKFTSDDVLFQVFAERNELAKGELKTAREEFFSTGQACFRGSPLTKRYGWGVHSNTEGKIALCGLGSPEYKKFLKEKKVKKLKALKSHR